LRLAALARGVLRPKLVLRPSCDRPCLAAAAIGRQKVGRKDDLLLSPDVVLVRPGHREDDGLRAVTLSGRRTEPVVSPLPGGAFPPNDIVLESVGLACQESADQFRITSSA
jgi:hypothetical protein